MPNFFHVKGEKPMVIADSLEDCPEPISQWQTEPFKPQSKPTTPPKGDK
jgi:hypothetical protein